MSDDIQVGGFKINPDIGKPIIRFYDGLNEVGSFDFSKRPITFTGDADASAKVFVDFVISHFNLKTIEPRKEGDEPCTAPVETQTDFVQSTIPSAVSNAAPKEVPSSTDAADIPTPETDARLQMLLETVAFFSNGAIYAEDMKAHLLQEGEHFRAIERRLILATKDLTTQAIIVGKWTNDYADLERRAEELEKERDEATELFDESIRARQDLATRIGCKECDCVSIGNHFSELGIALKHEEAANLQYIKANGKLAKDLAAMQSTQQP